MQLLVGPVKVSKGNEKERKERKATGKQLLQHIDNNLRSNQVRLADLCSVSKRSPWFCPSKPAHRGLTNAE